MATEGPTPTVLVVDDDPHIREVVRFALEKAGLQVVEAASGRAALERFLGYHVRAERELVDTEARVATVLDVPTPSGGTEAVRLTGFIDHALVFESQVQGGQSGRCVSQGGSLRDTGRQNDAIGTLG